MQPKTLQDILALVDQPSRYLGSETNRVLKDSKTVRLFVALAFPDLYEIGTSHFGLQILYDLLNRRPDVAAERVYAPAADMEQQLRESGLPLASLESRTPLARFDLIGFSLLYELGYTNVLAMLDLAGLPPMARDRDGRHPLIIAGGPCTSNPEPVADFFDAMVVGDGETVIEAMVSALIEWKTAGDGDRTTLLHRWAAIEGVYVPSFFEPVYGSDGLTRLIARAGTVKCVRRAVVADMDSAPFPGAPIIPFSRPVHDRLRIEVSRGCTRGCRFCQAGMIYRPVRERNVDTLVELAEKSLAVTGYEDLSLLSLSTGDYTHITDLAERLMTQCEAGRVAISLPSLRAGTLTPELMRLIRRVRKTGFTLAPEAGSQRLRDVINKNISESDILDTVQNAFALGWKHVKLYFMIGLPTETETDLKGIVDLVKTIRKIKGPGGRKGQIHVSVGTFIPKPHTPFQWAGQIDIETAKARMVWLKEQLRLPGIQFKWQNPETSLIEGLWSRGDRRMAELLLAAFRLGCRFDGWSDRFRFDLWCQAIEETGIDKEAFTSRHRDLDEPLPWDHIDTRVSKEFLRREWEQALGAIPTADCRSSDCNLCGVCDFKTISPQLAAAGSAGTYTAVLAGDAKTDGYKTLRVCYRKVGTARFFGHLELINIFTRAIRRCGIAVKYSEGFHPKPRISFEDTLPVGMESLAEAFYLTVVETQKPAAVFQGLRGQLPDGLEITDCRLAPQRSNRRMARAVRYCVVRRDGTFSENTMAAFEQRENWVVTRVRPNGKRREIDLKKAVYQMVRNDPETMEMVLAAGPGETVRPSEVLSEVFEFQEAQIRASRILKIETLSEVDLKGGGSGHKEDRPCSNN
ncbi:MAG: TIGR03960 family B12-binding radical SAM protein [Desulfobacterales bacterium]|nr:TIGR03960 family B12-binding radical SAM protein [Desulfobacterales bacterium]